MLYRRGFIIHYLCIFVSLTVRVYENKLLLIFKLLLQLGQRLPGIVPIEIIWPPAAPQNVLHLLLLKSISSSIAEYGQSRLN
jgi:hypothetical protein